MAKKKTTKKVVKKATTKVAKKKTTTGKQSTRSKKKTTVANTEPPAVKKKAALKKNKAWAIEAMSEWLAHPMEFGRPPVECEVVYEKNIPWGDSTEKVFLVRYKMDDGFETIGFTGPTTWSFMGIPLAEINKLKKRFVMRRMLNLYMGWYHTFFAYHDDSYRKKHEPHIMNAKEFAEAYQAYAQDSIYVKRDFAVKNVEAMGSTWSISVPLEACEITCPADPDVIFLLKDYHYVAPIRLTVNWDKLPSLEKTGATEFELNIACLARKKSAAKPIKISSVRSIDPDWPVFSKVPLYHYIGTLYGPVFFASRSGALLMFDH